MIPKLRLGELLREAGKLDDTQLKNALDRQRQTGRRLGTVLKDLGYVSDEDIAHILARQLKFPYFSARLENVDVAVARRFTELQVRKLRALPVGRDGARWRVAIADPMDWQAVDELPKLLGGEVDLEIVPESGLMALLDRIYNGNDNLQGLAREASEDLRASQSEGIDFSILGLQATAEDAPIVRLLQGLFEEAARARASDIHIEPGGQSVVVRLRVDGHLRVHSELEARLAPAMTSRLKLLSGLDISERRLPQDGRFVVQVRQQTVDIRVSTLPGQHGESVVMRLLIKDPMLARLDKLGIPDDGLTALQQALAQGAGLVLVTGPTGSGKTTTLYAALGALDATQCKIITAEDPVEYRLSGITQVNVHDRIGLGFAQVLRAALRQDPDVILIGEMRDQTTAEIGLRAAMTGHLVLSTLHTNDALSTPLRLVDMGVPRYMVALSLQLVLAQRLVRTVCPACAGPHRLDAHQHEWLRQLLGAGAFGDVETETAIAGLRTGRGCSECNHTGYNGRTGVYEFVEMTQELVEAMADDDPIRFMQAGRRQMAGATLRRDALRLAFAGRTTLEEAMRVGNELDP